MCDGDTMVVDALWLMMPNGLELVVDVLPGTVVAPFEGDFKSLRKLFTDDGRVELHCDAIMDTTTGYILKHADKVDAKALKRKLKGTTTTRKRKKPCEQPRRAAAAVT